MPEHLSYLASTTIEAARAVDILPDGHRSKGVHGHSFGVRLRTQLPDNCAAYLGGDVQVLEQALAQAVAPLDYSFLNDQITVPTDENVGRWVRQQSPLFAAAVVGIQSTANEGVDLDTDGIAHVWRRYRFEAAHRLPNVPPGHQCGRMHGHGFDVILHASQNIDDGDMGTDYDALDQHWAAIAPQLHMACLNDVPGLENPTSEMISAWIWSKLKPGLPELSWVTVFETVTAGCHFDGTHFRIWKEQRFEAAVALSNAPTDSPQAQLHGHSYLIRLHLTADLDETLGWTVDYGDVKELFKPTYKQLDHHRLDVVEGIDHGDCASIARWIKGRVSHVLPALDRIDLYETPGNGVSLAWGPLGPALPI